jgi:N-methylhydantoinase B
MLLANTRTPYLLDGDLRAMLGSTQIGSERVAAIFDDLGHEQGMAYLNGILDYADRRFRAEVEALPDGVYVGEEVSNNDCFSRTEIRYKVTLTVSGDQLTVDFTGTSPQIKGFKNSSFANTHAATYTGLSSFFDPDLPRNEGTFRSVKLVIPYGSTLNPKFPAATTFATAFPAHDIIQACWKALSQAVPTKTVAGWGKAIIPLSAGVDEAGATTYVLYHWNGLSGGGAVLNRDGLNQIAHLSTLGGLTLPNIELWEQLYPIHVHRHEFRCDAAGAGQWRGGTGIEYDVDILTPANYSFRGEGLFDPSGYGAAGGLPGAAGECTTFATDGEEFTPPQYSLVNLAPTRLVLSSPAGGGVGDPSARDVRDVRDGIVSEQAARSIYKVALASDGRSIDPEGTRALRASA